MLGKQTEAIAYSQHDVAFLDILGWRELIRQSVEDSTLRSRLAAVLSALKVDTLRPAAERVALQFSDTLVIAYARNTFSLYHLLWDVARLTQRLLVHGVLVRGGITRGLLFLQDSIVFGPALTQAYDLEHASARFPRVILSRSVESDALNLESYATTDSLGTRLGRDKLLRHGVDGAWFVDFLQPANATTAPDLDVGPSAEHLNLVRPIILSGLQLYRDEHIQEKYVWLAHYFNDVAAEYPDARVKPIAIQE